MPSHVPQEHPGTPAGVPIVPLTASEQRPSPAPSPESEWRALQWCAMAAVAAIVWTSLPVGVGIFLGALMAFSCQPLHAWVRRHVRHGSTAALITTMVAAIATLATLAGLATLFIARALVIARATMGSFGSSPEAGALLSRFAPVLARVGFTPEAAGEKLREAVADLAARAATAAEMLASTTAGVLMALFFAVVTMHLLLRNWASITAGLQQIAPLRPDYTRALLDEFQRVGRTTLLGTVITGVAQGFLATLAYVAAGVREPVFLGIATAIASLIPAVGTLLVWVPAGVVLLLTGHPAAGIGLLVWGTVVVVGVSDYVIRPRLVGEESMPSLVTFVALFGGAEVFGLKGLVLGPVVVALATSVLRIYAREAMARRGAAAPGR